MNQDRSPVTVGTTDAARHTAEQGGRANGSVPLARLRGEAAALHERADYLRRSAERLEEHLRQLLGTSGGRITPKIRQVQRTARETATLLEQTLARRNEVRAQILAQDRRAARAAEATRATETPRARAIQAARADAAPPAPRDVLPVSTPIPAPAPAPPAPPAPAIPATAAADAAEVRAAEQVGRTDERAAPAAEIDRVATSAAAPAVPARAPASTETALPVETERPVETQAPRIRRQQLRPLTGSTTGRLAWRTARGLAAAAMGVVVVVLALLLTPLPELLGVQLFAVLSGSMEPTIPVGSVIVVQPVGGDELEVGDVITFSDRGRPDLRVTHRIVDLQTKNGQRVATTKGDANNTTDLWDVPTAGLVGRVAYHVPYGGYLMAWLVSPLVKLLALALAAVLMFVPSLPIFGRAQRPAAPTPRRPQPVAPERVIRAERATRPSSAETAPAAAGATPTATGASPDETADETFDALAREIEALLGEGPAVTSRSESQPRGR